MASVTSRNGTWYAKYKDHKGKTIRISTDARSKTEAKRLAEDLERKAERQRLGLEPPPLLPLICSVL